MFKLLARLFKTRENSVLKHRVKPKVKPVAAAWPFPTAAKTDPKEYFQPCDKEMK